MCSKDVHGKAHEVVNVVGHIEQSDLTPIPLEARKGSPKSLFGMWIGANVNYVVMLTGFSLIALKLSFFQAISAVLVGNLLGCTVLGISSIFGPKTGTSGMATSRVAFGHLGAYLPTIISTISVLGWFSINSIVATDGLIELFKAVGLPDGDTIMWISLALVLIGEITLAIYGHATIIRYEQIIAVVLGVLFIGLFLFVLPYMNWSHASSIVEGEGSSGFGTWLFAMSLIFAYPISWTNFASDYSRYLPPNTSSAKVAFYAGAGQFTALTCTQFIGVCLGIAVFSTFGTLPDDPVSMLPSVLPNWYFLIFMFCVIMGCVATNVPNGYTAGLHLLALRLPITRVQGILIIGGITLVFRIVTLLAGRFFSLYMEWLSYIVYWSCPWLAIIIVDYLLRKGRYDGKAIIQWGGGTYWYKNGIHLPAVVCFIVGITGSLLFANSTLYQSPLMLNYFGGADFSLFVGMLLTGALYYFSTRNSSVYKAVK